MSEPDDPEALAEDSAEGGLVAAYLRNRSDPAAAEARARQWAKENAEAIRRHAEFIEKYGVFGDDLRLW